MLLPIYYMIYLALATPGKEFDVPAGVVPDPISLGQRADAPAGATTSLWATRRTA